MKTKYWIAIIAVILVVCCAASIPLLLPGEAARAEILSNGEVVRVVDLSIDQEFTVTSPDGGTNTVTVKDGCIAVTHASCPDQYCALRGWCSGGAQIVCLPNRLVIRFLGEQEIDSMVG